MSSVKFDLIVIGMRRSFTIFILVSTQGPKCRKLTEV
jgi:hypothetical protein